MNATQRRDFESRQKSCILSIDSKIEDNVASIYTRNVFIKFYNKLVNVNHFTNEKIEKIQFLIVLLLGIVSSLI